MLTRIIKRRKPEYEMNTDAVNPYSDTLGGQHGRKSRMRTAFFSICFLIDRSSVRTQEDLLPEAADQWKP
eukprot:scaffold4164_cov431-Prasinococcus_capsulatus_cf.AAC.3